MMTQRRSWFGITLSLLLTVLVVYAPQRLLFRAWRENAAETELPYTVLASVHAPGGYVSPDSHLWLITRQEQIEQVRYFALPEVITQLEQVDYRRYAVIALLMAADAPLTLERITAGDGVLTVYVQAVTPPGTPSNISGYQILQIPRNRTTQALRKLVLHSLPALPPAPSPISTPTPARQPASPIGGTVGP